MKLHTHIHVIHPVHYHQLLLTLTYFSCLAEQCLVCVFFSSVSWTPLAVMTYPFCEFLVCAIKLYFENRCVVLSESYDWFKYMQLHFRFHDSLWFWNLSLFIVHFSVNQTWSVKCYEDSSFLAILTIIKMPSVVSRLLLYRIRGEE